MLLGSRVEPQEINFKPKDGLVFKFLTYTTMTYIYKFCSDSDWVPLHLKCPEWLTFVAFGFEAPTRNSSCATKLYPFLSTLSNHKINNSQPGKSTSLNNSGQASIHGRHPL